MMLPRVLHLVETLQIGGTETQAVQTALHQHSTGQQVVVGCLRAEGPLLEVLQLTCIPVIEFSKQKKLLSIHCVWQLLRLAVFLRRERFKVLHCHDLMSNLLGVPAARLAGTPIVISSRRYLDLEWWRGSWRNRMVGWIYKLSTYVIVNSKSIRDLLIQRDGVRREKIQVIYNGIDLDRFGESVSHHDATLSAIRKHSVLVAVAANMYSPVKGHATLIAAAKRVCDDFPQVRFVLIGDGVERPRLEELVKRAELQEHFLFLGSRKNVPELLASCNLFVLPSESEGLPNVVLEAMAAGLPVIATAVGGVPELIQDGVTGLLVPSREPKELSASILRLLRDEELCGRLGRAGRERVVRDFTFDRLINVLKRLYTELPQSRPVRKQRWTPLQPLVTGSTLVDHINE